MKKLCALALMVLGATSLSGCFSFVDWEHNKNHAKAWNNNFDEIHNTVDYFFFDYDWNDPSSGYNYETPNTH